MLCAAPSPQLAMAHADHSITLRDAVDGSLPIGNLCGHTAAVNVLRFSSDGADLASGDAAGQLLVWAGGDLEGGSCAATLPHPCGVKSIAFHHTACHRQLARCVEALLFRTLFLPDGPPFKGRH